MTNDAAVACHRVRSAGYAGYGVWRDGDIPIDEAQYWESADSSFYIERAYSATTVAELRAEVERLRVQLAGCGVIALSNTSDSLAEQMPPTSAYGWSPSLVEVHDAVFREIQNRERADAAERRVAECESVLALVLGRMLSGAVKCKPLMTKRDGDYVVGSLQELIEQTLTKESP